jgi:signal transduction histidine kinase
MISEGMPVKTDPAYTQFASPARSAPEVIADQHRHLVSQQYVAEILDALPFPTLLINSDRQVVMVNRPLLSMLALEEQRQALGQRPGELMGCIHGHENAAGCGTAEACSVCGAVLAVLESQRLGQRAERECRIQAQGNDGVVALDLMVTATPLQVEGIPFTFVSMTDISDVKRRRALERIFFHDITNAAGGVQSILELLHEEDDPEQSQTLLELAGSGAARLVNEIQSHRLLTAAESDDLAVAVTVFDVLELVQSVAARYRWHQVGQGKKIEVDLDAEGVVVESDMALLERVLGNLIKNALEASRRGDTVTVGCGRAAAGVELWVHNPAVMPREAQLQVFQRSFSTKGTGRGLGTYSVRLLTERYLHGKVSFTSVEGEGTTFKAVYPLQWAAV